MCTCFTTCLVPRKALAHRFDLTQAILPLRDTLVVWKGALWLETLGDSYTNPICGQLFKEMLGVYAITIVILQKLCFSGAKIRPSGRHLCVLHTSKLYEVNKRQQSARRKGIRTVTCAGFSKVGILCRVSCSCTFASKIKPSTGILTTNKFYQANRNQ